MGIDINAVQFLIAARREGIEFGRVLTLGRLDLNVFPAKMHQVLKAAGLPAEAYAPGAPDNRFSESLFTSLGARSVQAMDASDFEGAEVVHDLNQPVPDRLKQQYDLVYDGGTLEHVFQFPTALQNCMEMVRPGGSLVLHTVTNNYCGHGFYQLSPELFYSALSEENGYALERMVLHMMGPYGRWYEVSDPRKIRSRVELVTMMPVQLLIRARRQAVRPIFARPPQQSDYTPRWSQKDGSGAAPAEDAQVVYAAPRPKLAGSLPGVARLLNVIRSGMILLRTQTLRNRKAFQPIKKG